VRAQYARRTCLAVAAAIAVSACDTGPEGTGLVPTFATPTAKTETFTGTVPVGGSDSHPFSSANYGEVSITLTSAGPASDVVMGVGIGAPTSIVDSSCRLYQNAFVNTPAGSTPQLTGNIPAGSYCVQVFDSGSQAAPVTYSVTVVHVQ
jgi:hypothetical protein